MSNGYDADGKPDANGSEKTSSPANQEEDLDFTLGGILNEKASKVLETLFSEISELNQSARVIADHAPVNAGNLAMVPRVLMASKVCRVDDAGNLLVPEGFQHDYDSLASMGAKEEPPIA
jgi:hypothetical protein